MCLLQFSLKRPVNNKFAINCAGHRISAGNLSVLKPAALATFVLHPCEPLDLERYSALEQARTPQEQRRFLLELQGRLFRAEQDPAVYDSEGALEPLRTMDPYKQRQRRSISGDGPPQHRINADSLSALSAAGRVLTAGIRMRTTGVANCAVLSNYIVGSKIFARLLFNELCITFALQTVSSSYHALALKRVYQGTRSEPLTDLPAACSVDHNTDENIRVTNSM